MPGRLVPHGLTFRQANAFLQTGGAQSLLRGPRSRTISYTRCHTYSTASTTRIETNNFTGNAQDTSIDPDNGPGASDVHETDSGAVEEPASAPTRTLSRGGRARVRAALRKLREKKSWAAINSMSSEALAELLQTFEDGPRRGWRALSPDQLAPYVAIGKDALARDLEHHSVTEAGPDGSGRLRAPAKDAASKIGRRRAPRQPRTRIYRVKSKTDQCTNTEGKESEETERSIVTEGESGQATGRNQEDDLDTHLTLGLRSDDIGSANNVGLDNSIEAVRAVLRNLMKQMKATTRLRGPPKPTKNLPRLQRQFRVARARLAYLERQTAHMPAHQRVKIPGNKRGAIQLLSPEQKSIRDQPIPNAAKGRSSHTEACKQSETAGTVEGVSISEKLKSSRRRTVGFKGGRIDRISASQLQIESIDVGKNSVPHLCHGLDRVLFNPGVYHLQDPRSRVYNFDPYLEKIMPVQEFDWDALNPYITSSQDEQLSNAASAHQKKFVCSTSSTTAVLSHFHFLLSQWRKLNFSMLTNSFPVTSTNFTTFVRSPAAIFLRRRNGFYAIDADKEYDEPTILSKLGHSLEKLLTIPVSQFKKYGRSNPQRLSEVERSERESYHFSTISNFIMRSQLDAHDPRLPGTGIFDLKTRAVVSVRMNSRDDPTAHTGYQIRYRQGEWESYEREYHDMVRSTMLKYSLQVRMGRMDGIFVAYHNVDRIFGFQYISLPEMDEALHRQSDTALGDEEFKLSMGLFNEVLERAVAKFPEQSIRLHFETREAKVPFMYIFAEPMSEEEIEAIEEKAAARRQAYDEALLRDSPVSEAPLDEETAQEWQEIEDEVADEVLKSAEQKSTQPVAVNGSDDLRTRSSDDVSTGFPEREPDSTTPSLAGEERLRKEYSQNDATEHPDPNTTAPTEQINQDRSAGFGTPQTATGFALEQEAWDKGELESILTSQVDQESIDASSTSTDTSGETEAETVQSKEILAMVLIIRNKVNGAYVIRPDKFKVDDEWEVEYSLQEVGNGKKLYDACRKRRKKAVDALQMSSYSYFQKLLNRFSNRGRQWRKSQDAIDEKMGRILFTPMDSTVPTLESEQKQPEESNHS